MEKRRDLHHRLAQGASLLILAACASVTYECVRIHDIKANQPHTPLADAALQPETSPEPVKTGDTASTPPAKPEVPSQGFFSSLFNKVADGKDDKNTTGKDKTADGTGKGGTGASTVEAVPTGPAVTTSRVKALPFDFLEVSKQGRGSVFEVTQRITGNKLAYGLNLNPGWGELDRPLVDKSFFNTKGVYLFIFVEEPDSWKMIRAPKYQETYAQDEVDKIAATHPSLIPFKFEQEVRSFRFRNWGSFRFVQNGITKLVLYTHAGKNGKYTMVVSSQKDLLSSEMRKIWMNPVETFEVSLTTNPPKEEVVVPEEK